MSTGDMSATGGPDGLHFRRCSPPAARTLRESVRTIYTASYVDAIASGHSFDSVEAFMSRFDAYSASPEFDMVMAYHDGRPVAQAWGWRLREETRWWDGLHSAPEPDFTREDGHRTFALSEIMVVQDCGGQGIAHATHDELLAARTEERAVLLVEPDNTVARRAYLHWGWRAIARLRPNWNDAPQFEVFVKNLSGDMSRRQT